MASQPTTENPRAARTRAALLDAGFALLAERPIDAIAIDDIVVRAGVAKGSFFNHFSDKQGFAAAIAQQVRAALEQRIGAGNAGVVDPAMRLASGMRVGIEFALEDRVRATIMLRGMQESSRSDHELNRGIRADIDRLVCAGLARNEAAGSGVRYWLGLCHMAMLNVLERGHDRSEAARRLRDMLVLGLCGLGVGEGKAREVAEASASLLCPAPGQAQA
ncbi:TetR/AcrR family transcriptional regulator [Novosphingobium sp. B 225]|uniref:TetR/AcrR family transcriptional regulator n=1 Tax=Novosphingobium sp. B 225 TaxID=1961849 RepID=UPI000B4A638F|nr:TetR/AcrR family transcriptional regulator [Novosphingobium sp. B 225]